MTSWQGLSIGTIMCKLHDYWSKTKVQSFSWKKNKCHWPLCSTLQPSLFLTPHLPRIVLFFITHSSMSRSNLAQAYNHIWSPPLPAGALKKGILWFPILGSESPSLGSMAENIKDFGHQWAVPQHPFHK